jgi:pre-mRNA-splicing factor SYF1
MQLCELLSTHPGTLPNDEAIIRSGIQRYSDEVGKLWIHLADLFSRNGSFDKTREVFEEALAVIVTARDFGIIFNAYMKFEEEMIDESDPV